MKFCPFRYNTLISLLTLNQFKMKKIISVLIFAFVVLLLQNCSSVKVLDSWKSDNVSDIKNRNFLVVARSNNKQARLAFENEIVKMKDIIR